ncbi:MAG: aldolase/citrate lyase family protein [Planctomycetota bacterium]|nr:aldolase/citrate lyase family protein [Planctomycetota bacterium]MDA1164889.1 aldolase/citrate lyase family protein [Planctomycetota bacterium]
MQLNTVKQKLLAGGSSIGTFMFEFHSAGVARAAAATGAEYAIFDMEHTGWSVETIRMLCATSHGTEMVPLVRVPATEYHFIARVLDMGAKGVMVPMVESVEQAQLLVSSAKYPPVGRRGCAFGIGHDDYTGGDVVAKMQHANENQILIAQIETAAGLENVEAIAAVDGIDVLWIGQSDLSASIGIPGQFDHPKFLAAMDRVIAACNDNGKVGGLMPTTLDFAEVVVSRGFRMLAWSGDVWIYQAGLKAGMNALRDFASR